MGYSKTFFIPEAKGFLKEDVEIKLPGKSGRPIADKVKCNLGEFARKVYIPGKSMCTLCNKLINYGNHFWYSLYFSTWVWAESEWYCYLLLFNMEIHISKSQNFLKK